MLFIIILKHSDRAKLESKKTSKFFSFLITIMESIYLTIYEELIRCRWI